MKLCLLTFTRNNFDEAIDKVHRYYEFFDKFIIIDSSSEPPPDPRLSKVIVLRAPSFGHVEPLLQFGVRRAVETGCDWVVRLDVDEEFSEHSLRDLRDILENSDCDAYTIIFYAYGLTPNHVECGDEKPRIFRPDKAYHSAIIHGSEAQIHGKICKLDPTKYYIKHLQGIPLYKDHEKLKRYAEIESYERPLTLRTLILRALALEPRLPSLLSKFPLPASVLPYPIFFVMLQLRRWRIRKLIDKTTRCITKDPYYYSKFVYDYMKNLSPREFVTRVHIVADMYRVGDVTKYLCLDSDDIIERLTKIAERIENFGGVKFFGILMKLRYVSGGCDYVDRLEKILG